MAIEGGYEPFANDVDAPDAAHRPQAAVAAAAHRVLEHYLPAQEAAIIDPAYIGVAGHDRRRVRQRRTASRSARR